MRSSSTIYNDWKCLWTHFLLSCSLSITWIVGIADFLYASVCAKFMWYFSHSLILYIFSTAFTGKEGFSSNFQNNRVIYFITAPSYSTIVFLPLKCTFQGCINAFLGGANESFIFNYAKLCKIMWFRRHENNSSLK